MDRLSPEILHIIASCLSIQDAITLRLVNKNLSVIAGAHILPEVLFYLHEKDLAKLRAIAAHPVLSRNVQSLTYFAQVLENPPLEWAEFMHDHRQLMMMARLAPNIVLFPPWKGKLSRSQLEEHYEKYKQMVASQDELTRERLDLTCLKEILPSLTALRCVTMSSGNLFYEAGRRPKRRTPYDDVARVATHELTPEGCLHMEVLLDALAYHDIHIEQLRAGTLSWRFFDKDRQRLSRLFKPLTKLKEIDLVLTAETDDEGVEINHDNSECRQLLKKGFLRDLFKSMLGLERLVFSVEGDHSIGLARGASLNDLFSPTSYWPNLVCLELRGIESSRRDLWNLLEAHKDTLESLCLQNIHLTEGSWKKLLPDIRHKLCLHEVCVCGTSTGYSEDGTSTSDPTRPDERFNFWAPETGPSDMRDSVNMYCCLGGTQYPEELPLTKQVVRKNFERYVRQPGTLSEKEDEREMQRIMAEMEGRWGDAGQYLPDNSEWEADDEYGDEELSTGSGEDVD